MHCYNVEGSLEELAQELSDLTVAKITPAPRGGFDLEIDKDESIKLAQSLPRVLYHYFLLNS